MTNHLALTSDDVQDAYEGEIRTDQVRWVERKLDQAVRELYAVIPTLKARVDSEKIDVDLVKDKVVDAVLRVVRNPLGIDREGEGDYTIHLRNTVASGDIWYQDKDLIQLGYEAPGKANKIGSFRAKATPGWGFPA